MHKIISVTDLNGLDKLDKIKVNHSNLLGTFVNEVISFGSSSLNFEWADDSGKILTTSYVEDIEIFENKIKVTTENSIYVFEEVV